MSAELVVTYSSLGTQDGDDYYKGEECHGRFIVHPLTHLSSSL